MSTNQVPQNAADMLFAGYNCAQAVLYANCERLQFDKNVALKVATGFGAGIAREGDVCGAVAGGVMAISLRYGRAGGEDRSKTEETYAKTREFMDRFKKRHGSLTCRELIGCDPGTTEGQKYFKENDLLHRTCAPCVQTASELVDAAI
jgi:C_GCAxxG_C_C family probable redox protein